MAIEQAGTSVVRKPWGSTDLRPWSQLHDEAVAIGELWFQRADARAPDPALLLKLLFTQAALSIQVHPDDVLARSLGLENGKTEAWYILSAMPGAKVAVGLKRRLTGAQLRTSIENGSISSLIKWRNVQEDEAIFVPAGTIHAIGSGLVIAEIQQRSDATFRLFDFGRHRELHVDNAVAAASRAPPEDPFVPRRLSDARTLLVAGPYFVLERIDLPARSRWELRAERETWLLVLDGHARIGAMKIVLGGAIFLEADQAGLEVGAAGLRALLAYVGSGPDASLLEDLGGHDARLPLPHDALPISPTEVPA